MIKSDLLKAREDILHAIESFRLVAGKPSNEKEGMLLDELFAMSAKIGKLVYRIDSGFYNE